MSAMVASSSLNPDAPLFVPAAFRQVEDFSPQWWDLVKSTAWFRDHWYNERQQLDDMADSLLAFEAEQDLAGLLPDAIDDADLFYENNTSTVGAAQPPVALKTGTNPTHHPLLVLVLVSPSYLSAQIKLIPMSVFLSVQMQCSRRWCLPRVATTSRSSRRRPGTPRRPPSTQAARGALVALLPASSTSLARL
jgi:hypothetical protein